MKISEIHEALRAGTITLNHCGHNINDPMPRLMESYDDWVSGAAGDNDGKWSPQEGKTVEEIDFGMREMYRKDLEREVAFGTMMRFPFMRDGEYCFGCGKKMNWVLEEGKLELRGYFDHEFRVHRVDHVCEFKEIVPFVGKIKVASNLIIANFFHFPDCPPEEKYDNEWSLNCSAGRRRRAEYLEKSNIAYGQMGNMSIGVYINSAKTSIILGNPWSDDGFEGYEFVERISLAVWRWEATDLNTLGGQSVVDELGLDQDEIVSLDVVHGTWEFKHYYDMIRREDGSESDLYARLDLVP